MSAGGAAGDGPGGDGGDGGRGDGGDGGGERSAGPIAAGVGRARLLDQHALRLGVLRGLSRFLEAHVDPSGALLDTATAREPAGSVAYGALVDLAAWRFTREEHHADRARRAALRAVDQLVPGPDGGSVFPAGEGDPGQGDSLAAAGGAVCDVLCTLLDEAPDLLAGRDAERARAAVTRHVETFLLAAARSTDRAPLARAWAATGLARAARALGRPAWGEVALAACRAGLDALGAEGLLRVPPRRAPRAAPDLAESRQALPAAFALHVHAVLDAPWTDQARARLAAALESLLALRDGNGRKSLRLEVDACDWGSRYEVASHPFDAYALHRGGALLGDPVLAAEAGSAMEEWIAHLNPLDGGVDSHQGGGRSAGSRIVWTSHGAWAARIIEDVPLRATTRALRDVVRPAAGLAHVERDGYVAILRGRHDPPRLGGGCDVGGGQPLSIVVRADARVPRGTELVELPPRGGVADGCFALGAAGLARLPRALALLRAAGSEPGERPGPPAPGAWRAAWSTRLLPALRIAGIAAAAQWDQATEQDGDGAGIVFRGALADWSGRRLDGTRTERAYRFEPDGVRVRDAVELTGVRGRLRYRLPAALAEVEVHSEGAPARRQGRAVTVDLGGGGTVAVVVSGLYPVGERRARGT